MNDSPFDVISKYCLDHGKDFPVRNHAFAIFTQKLKDAVENHRQKNRGAITPEIEKALLQSHLSANELGGSVAEAERIIRAAEEELLRPYRKGSRLREFSISVLASVLGALILTGLLFSLFVLAENQIRPVFRQIFKNDPHEQMAEDVPKSAPTADSAVPTEGTP